MTDSTRKDPVTGVLRAPSQWPPHLPDPTARMTKRFEHYYLMWRCAACGGEHTVYLGDHDSEGPIISAEQEVVNETYAMAFVEPAVVETEIRYRLLPEGGTLDLTGCLEVTSGGAPVHSYSALQEAIEAVVLDPDERAALYRELGLLS